MYEVGRDAATYCTGSGSTARTPAVDDVGRCKVHSKLLLYLFHRLAFKPRYVTKVYHVAQRRIHLPMCDVAWRHVDCDSRGLFKVARRKGGNCCYGFILINTIITTRGKLFLSTTMPTTPPSKFLQAVIFFNKSKTKTKITQRQQNPWSVESWVLRPPNRPPAVLQRRPLVLARLLRLPEPRLHGRPRPCAARARVRL